MIEQLPNAFNQVDQQIAQGQPATVLVERSNGDITTAQLANITLGETNVFFGNIANGPQYDMPYKPVGNERLTDQYQELLATKLAGAALRSTVVYGESTAQNAAPQQNKIIDAVPSFAKSNESPKPIPEKAASEPVKRELTQEQWNKIREIADNKYAQVMQFTSDNTAAEAAAARVWKTYGVN